MYNVFKVQPFSVVFFVFFFCIDAEIYERPIHDKPNEVAPYNVLYFIQECIVNSPVGLSPTRTWKRSWEFRTRLLQSVRCAFYRRRVRAGPWTGIRTANTLPPACPQQLPPLANRIHLRKKKSRLCEKIL